MLADRALLSVALHAVSCASRLSRGVRHEFASKGGVLTKSDTSPVTVADFGVQALVTLFLREHAPADRFRLVAEEEADALARDPELLQTVTSLVNQHYPRAAAAAAAAPPPRWAEADVLDALSRGGDGGGDGAFWFLDPIDGTRGFVRGGHYAIGLGRVSGGVPSLAAIGCPTLPEPGGSFGADGVLAPPNQHTIQTPPPGTPAAQAPAAAAPGTGLPLTAEPSGVVFSEPSGFLFGAWSGGPAKMMPLSEAEALCASASPADTDWEGRMRVVVPPQPATLTPPLCVVESFAGEQCAHRFRCFGGECGGAGGERTSPSGITFLRLDSMAKYCLVAQGTADAFVRAPLSQSEHIWDHAAALVVGAAGGRVTDFDGAALDFSLGRGLSANRGILATSASAPSWLHDEMLRCAPEACPPGPF